MYLLYSLALSLLFAALLPYFVYQAVRYRKYSSSFKQRMGWLPEPVRGDGRRTIWIHAVSVGEFLEARPLIDRLKSELPDHRIVISTTTLTGQRLAQSQSASFEASFYFPFDWKFAVWRALAWVEPSVVVVLETELWPNFLRECRRRRIVTVLANGRISPRSFRRYTRVRSLIARVLQDFSLLVMQSEADAERARLLGAASGNVRVSGNLKYDFEVENDRDRQISNPQHHVSELDDVFALSASPHLIVAGSTSPGEEETLLAALAKVRSHSALSDARLLIAPRHPERFNEVANLISRSSFTFARCSQAKARSMSEGNAGEVPKSGVNLEGTTDPKAAQVILLDSIGELATVYRFAAVVFVGGSLVPRGGHNIIEPAAFAKPIIVGPHTENFRQIVADFKRNDAVVQLNTDGHESAASLADWVIRLLSDSNRAREMGERARNILLGNRGATERTVAAIKELIKADG